MKYRNVLHFADYGSPYKGNFISSLEVLEKKLIDNYHILFYVFPNRTSKRKWAQDKENVSFLTGNFFKDRKILKNLIKDKNIDIIHIHFYSFKTLLLFKTLKIKCKIIIHLHGMFPKYKGIKKCIMKKLFEGYNIIGCSNAVTDSFIYDNKKICIENAIYFPRLNKFCNMQEFEKYSNNEKILIFGYNYFIKGVDVTLEAIEKARRKKNNIICFVSISSNIESFKENVVKKFGFFPDWIKILKPINDITSYYKNCDIFISASREEGFCYAIVEAAYVGCNIIASEIPAQKELKIKNIYWFESENSNELKNRILECIKNKNSNSKKMLEQRKSIMNEYDIDKWAKDILDQYDKLSL